MGQRILISCDTCGCKKEMSVGAGLMSNNPEVIASCLPQSEAGEWRKIYDQQKVRFFNAQQKVFYCKVCNDLFCNLTVDAELTDGSKVTFGNYCTQCGGELQEVDMQAHHMVCPICRTGDLSWKQVGLWD